MKTGKIPVLELCGIGVEAAVLGVRYKRDELSQTQHTPQLKENIKKPGSCTPRL
jgi:hypothetical protein